MDGQQLPLSAAGKKRLYASGCAPIKVVEGVVAISQFGRDRHNALMRVVGQRDEDMNGAYALCCSRNMKQCQQYDKDQAFGNATSGAANNRTLEYLVHDWVHVVAIVSPRPASSSSICEHNYERKMTGLSSACKKGWQEEFY